MDLASSGCDFHSNSFFLSYFSFSTVAVHRGVSLKEKSTPFNEKELSGLESSLSFLRLALFLC